MPTYTYSEATIEGILDRAKRFRIKAIIYGVVFITASLALMAGHIFLPALRNQGLVWVYMPIFTLGGLALQRFWPRPGWREKALERLQAYSVLINESGVYISYPQGQKRHLERSEIVRLEEPKVGGGLYVRSANRYQWLLIPRDLDNYAAMKAELLQQGLPLAQKIIPTNAEEFVFVLLFCGTLFCSAFSRDVRVLSINLIVALLLTFAGGYIARANPDNRALGWKLKAGLAMPIFCCAMALWFAIKH